MRHRSRPLERIDSLTDAWMHGACQVRAAADGGPLRGGAPRVVWLTLEADPEIVSARSAAQRLIKLGRPPHLVWNPVTGEAAQLIPIVRAGRLLGGPEGLALADPPGAAAGGPAGRPEPGGCLLDSVNAEGRLCVQIAVVAFALSPFTSGPMTGHPAILDWLCSWRVKRHWPAGPPHPFGYLATAPRSRRLWAQGGHFGNSQVPYQAAAGLYGAPSGPGALDITRLTGCHAERTAALPAQGSRLDTAAARRAPAGRAAARPAGQPAGHGMDLLDGLAARQPGRAPLSRAS